MKKKTGDTPSATLRCQIYCNQETRTFILIYPETNKFHSPAQKRKLMVVSLAHA